MHFPEIREERSARRCSKHDRLADSIAGVTRSDISRVPLPTFPSAMSVPSPGIFQIQVARIGSGRNLIAAELSLLRYPTSIDDQRGPDGKLCVVGAEIQNRCGDLLGDA